MSLLVMSVFSQQYMFPSEGGSALFPGSPATAEHESPLFPSVSLQLRLTFFTCDCPRGSLTSPSYLVRNRTLGPPLENNPEIPPSSRGEGLRLLHGLATNLATSLQTPQGVYNVLTRIDQKEIEVLTLSSKAPVAHLVHPPLKTTAQEVPRPVRAV